MWALKKGRSRFRGASLSPHILVLIFYHHRGVHRSCVTRLTCAVCNDQTMRNVRPSERSRQYFV
ncbi:unnamed protein product [Amoebophrya sp. A120]|nr:unnamed protein product [Amoebophrya sp. A120]|eukprot:GSA120T00016396001.1